MLTDIGFDNAVSAQQVFGGHGYIAEWGMEQFVRDARIAMIYEGTNGIQALDLVGRKLAKDGGRALQAFFDEVRRAIVEEQGRQRGDGRLRQAARARRSAHLQQRHRCGSCRTRWPSPDNAGAGATDYMHLSASSRSATCGCRMAQVALRAGRRPDGEPFYQAKLTTARFFMERFAPDAGALRRKIETGAEAMMALGEDAFATAV